MEKAARSSAALTRISSKTVSLFLFALWPVLTASAIHISEGEAQRIGRRIWQNECNGTISGLTSWNAGENFASLGIGHFIWYPTGERAGFEESFPPLLRFMAARGARLPAFLQEPNVPCPWRSRREFEDAHASAPMKQLRAFLAGTIDLQAQFLVLRLQNSLLAMQAEARDPEKVRRQFERVGSSAQGCYALVDYVNFKGEGISPGERYRGQGWGLLQVLESMPDQTEAAPTEEFASAARAVLRRRVANAPPDRGEARWLAGWLRRVESYRTHE